MRNKDIIFASDSVSVETTKFMTYVNTINGTINDPLTTGINAYSLRGLIQGTSTPSVAVGGTTSVSDIRLKRDITKLTKLDNGLSLYRFRYLWSDTYYVGVMAQEVEQLVPDAVVRGSDGYLRVNYARLGLRFMTWDEWLADSQTRAIANTAKRVGRRKSLTLETNKPPLRLFGARSWFRDRLYIRQNFAFALRPEIQCLRCGLTHRFAIVRGGCRSFGAGRAERAQMPR